MTVCFTIHYIRLPHFTLSLWCWTSQRIFFLNFPTLFLWFPRWPNCQNLLRRQIKATSTCKRQPVTRLCVGSALPHRTSCRAAAPLQSKSTSGRAAWWQRDPRRLRRRSLAWMLERTRLRAEVLLHRFKPHRLASVTRVQLNAVDRWMLTWIATGDFRSQNFASDFVSSCEWINSLRIVENPPSTSVTWG